MYQNIYIEKSQHGKPTVHLWDDKRGYQKFQFTPYAYMKSQTGTMGCVIREDDFGQGTYFDVGYPVRAVYKRIFIKHRKVAK